MLGLKLLEKGLEDNGHNYLYYYIIKYHLYQQTKKKIE